MAILNADMAEVDRGGGFPCRPSVAPPLKAFMNLTSTVDNVAFSPDQQVKSDDSSDIFSDTPLKTHKLCMGSTTASWLSS